MAKICPITNKAVIYLTCAECDQKTDCRAGKLKEQQSASKNEVKK